MAAPETVADYFQYFPILIVFATLSKLFCSRFLHLNKKTDIRRFAADCDNDGDSHKDNYYCATVYSQKIHNFRSCCNMGGNELNSRCQGSANTLHGNYKNKKK